MNTVQGDCMACGTAVVFEAPPGFEGADLIGCVCPACADAELLDEGGAVLAPRPPDGALFALGCKVTVTSGAVAALAEAGLQALEFMTRHARGDWGRCGRAEEVIVTARELRLGPLATEDDAKLNKIAALTGEDRVLSSYTLPTGERLWVLTSPGGRRIHDRHAAGGLLTRHGTEKRSGGNQPRRDCRMSAAAASV